MPSAHLRGRVERRRGLKFPLTIGPIPDLDLTGIDWVIVGGESRPDQRPINKVWIHEILRACRKHKTAFFFKQWGGAMSKSGERDLNGRTYDEMSRARRMRACAPRSGAATGRRRVSVVSVLVSFSAIGSST